MKPRKIIISAVIVSMVIVLISSLRFAAMVADNKFVSPEKLVEKYQDGSGKTFYRINAGINNSYLLPCKDGWLLIDTGYPNDYEKFKLALEYINIELSSVKWLFITHSHDEHAGFAESIRRESGCHLILPVQAVDNLKNGQMVWNGKALNRRITVLSKLYDIIKKRDMKFPPVTVSINDMILRSENSAFPESIGVKGKFIYTPGHSPDSWSLIMNDGRVFCGDAAMNFLNSMGADYRPVFVTDETEMYISLKKILDSGIKTFYSGHGPAFNRNVYENK